MHRFNPFRPNYPVQPGMFIGRVAEIVRLESVLFQTRAGQPANFMITGERGIGKTSLMHYLKHIAQGSIPVGQIRCNFLVVELDIDRKSSPAGLIRRIELGLTRELGKSEGARKVLKDALKFISRVEAGGVKINPEVKTEEIDILIEEFSYSLADLVMRITDPEQTSSMFSAKYDGLLILIDEADNSLPSLDLGTFLKSLMERVQKRGCYNISIGLSGLPKLRNVLKESHPSSLRLFDHLNLGGLSKDESNNVIDTCLKKASEEIGVTFTITEEARESLNEFSEGYPHLIQQFGYSTFAEDRDNVLDSIDFVNGVLKEDGAARLIASRYYGDNFEDVIGMDLPRKILQILAQSDKDGFPESTIREQFQGTDDEFRSALGLCEELQMIFSMGDSPKYYRMQHRAFAMWVHHNLVDKNQKTESSSI